jgi:hypothetical protein
MDGVALNDHTVSGNQKKLSRDYVHHHRRVALPEISKVSLFTRTLVPVRPLLWMPKPVIGVPSIDQPPATGHTRWFCAFMSMENRFHDSSIPCLARKIAY